MEDKYIEIIKNKLLDYEKENKKKQEYIKEQLNKKLYMLSKEGIRERQELIYQKINDLNTELDNALDNIKNELFKDNNLTEDKIKEFEDSLEYIKKEISRDYKSIISDIDLFKLKKYDCNYIQYLCHKDGIITYKNIVIITPFSKHYNTVNKLNSIIANDRYKYNDSNQLNNLFKNIKIHDCFGINNAIERDKYKNEYNKDYINSLYFITYKISLYRHNHVNFNALEFNIIKTYYTKREENITHNFLIGLKLNINYDRSLLTIINSIFNTIDKQNIINTTKEVGFYSIDFFDKENNIYIKLNTIKEPNSESLYRMYLKEIFKDIDSLFDKDFTLLSENELLNTLDNKTKSLYNEFIKGSSEYEVDNFNFQKEENQIIKSNNKQNKLATITIIAVIILIIIAIYITR